MYFVDVKMSEKSISEFSRSDVMQSHYLNRYVTLSSWIFCSSKLKHSIHILSSCYFGRLWFVTAQVYLRVVRFHIGLKLSYASYTRNRD